MNRLAQLGIFCIVLGGVTLFLGIFPFSVNLNVTPGIGIAQIVAMLTGLFLIVGGSFVAVYAIARRGRPRSLVSDIGVRLGLTGLVFSSAATLADVMGFGTHSGSGLVFGWLQATGMLAGFGLAMVGVLIFGLARRR